MSASIPTAAWSTRGCRTVQLIACYGAILRIYGYSISALSPWMGVVNSCCSNASTIHDYDGIGWWALASVPPVYIERYLRPSSPLLQRKGLYACRTVGNHAPRLRIFVTSWTFFRTCLRNVCELTLYYSRRFSYLMGELFSPPFAAQSTTFRTFLLVPFRSP